MKKDLSDPSKVNGYLSEKKTGNSVTIKKDLNHVSISNWKKCKLM